MSSPSGFARAGGTRVTLRGTGFHDEMKVTFGAGAATIAEVPDPFTAIVLSPRGNTGVVDVAARMRERFGGKDRKADWQTTGR